MSQFEKKHMQYTSEDWSCLLHRLFARARSMRKPNLVPRVSLPPADSNGKRPWFRLVTCLPESGRLQINDSREGCLSMKFVSTEPRGERKVLPHKPINNGPLHQTKICLGVTWPAWARISFRCYRREEERSWERGWRKVGDRKARGSLERARSARAGDGKEKNILPIVPRAPCSQSPPRVLASDWGRGRDWRTNTNCCLFVSSFTRFQIKYIYLSEQSQIITAIKYAESSRSGGPAGLDHAVAICIRIKSMIINNNRW